MSFFKEQKTILKSCLWETTTFMTPGLSILNYNSKHPMKATALGSAGYFSLCIIRDEFTYIAGKGNDIITAGTTTASAVLGGIAYARINSYESSKPSVLMSLGYSYAYNYLPSTWAFSMPSTIIIELYTAYLSADTLTEGFISGVVYNAITAIHSVCKIAYTEYHKPPGLHEEDCCPILGLLEPDQCPAI